MCRVAQWIELDMTRGNAITNRNLEESRTRTHALLESWHQVDCDDEETRRELMEQIVLLNLDLCQVLARRYANRGIEFDDLVQVARLALIGAVQRYQPGSHSFTPYAIRTISGELKRYFRDHGWTVRPPRRLQELRAQVMAARSEVEQEVQASVGVTELSARVNSSAHDVAEAENLSSSFRPLSLEAPRADAGSIADRLGSCDPELELVPEILSLRAALTTLNARDCAVLRLRFVDELTQAEIGVLLGASQMQVSRMITRILDQLRHVMEPVGAAA